MKLSRAALPANVETAPVLAFVENNDLFCTPGFIMTAVEILNANTLYTDEELRKLLSGHLCRCTGYENILRAVKKTMYQRLGKPIDF